MNQITDAMDMVEHLRQIAFCVQNGVIVKVNTAASNRMIEAGTPVVELLKTGAEEYRDFNGGCLYLTLNICDQELGFSVCRKNGFDLFHQEQDEQADEFHALALAAREMREPLAGIMFSANRLTDDPAVDIQIARMKQSAMQLLRIICNMSDAGRFVMSDTVPMEIRNVSTLLDEIFAKSAVLAEHMGITLRYAGIADPIYSLVNVELLERAVLNIISNALKFTPQGGSIQATLQRQGNKLLLSIADNGSGIPENVRSNLFSRHTREPGLEEGRFGLGLGLVIVRSAAQQHGGTVLVDHPADCGTRVTLTLAIRAGKAGEVRSPMLQVDYAGERDHGLVEFSNILPAELYRSL